MDRWFDLPGHGAVLLTGPDAAKFLQGLSTNDMRLVTAAHSTPGALCQVNGRVSVIFRAVERDGNLLLRLPAALTPATLERLRRVVFRAQVKVLDGGAAIAWAGVSGPGAPEALARHAGAAPAVANEAATAGPFTIVRLPDEAPRFELAAPPEALERLREALPVNGFGPGDDALWTLLEIRAGLPEIAPETVDVFLPQNLDLERLSGLSFTKGCYPGQEVVARTQHLGEIKRRLVRARAATAQVPAPGTALCARAADGSARDGGKVVRAACGPDGTIELLAVIPVSLLADRAQLTLDGADGPPVTPA
jgi:folate-binding protein YgfZ